MFRKMYMVTLNDEKYITLSVIEEDGIQYAFVNKLDFVSEEPTDDYFILRNSNAGILKIMDPELIKKLMVKFEKCLREDIEDGLENI